ncbi:MAG TPA: nitroreductase/quinone reductase family protein [Candidatus Limnocylindria bacterium]|nr:nitroreductase/quinone reductase family protein [Candidatus Limnocylindria bacterium]
MTETPDTSVANAWEEALIADLRSNGGTPSEGPLTGHPLMLMYSTGAKTGERRRSILTCSRDGDAYVVAGTAGGSSKAPAWIANVTADPRVTLEVNNETFDATAKLAEGAERDRLWTQHAGQLPWFADYPAQVGGRVIPMVRLSRREG